MFYVLFFQTHCAEVVAITFAALVLLQQDAWFAVASSERRMFRKLIDSPSVLLFITNQ